MKLIMEWPFVSFLILLHLGTVINTQYQRFPSYEKTNNRTVQNVKEAKTESHPSVEQTESPSNVTNIVSLQNSSDTMERVTSKYSMGTVNDTSHLYSTNNNNNTTSEAKISQNSTHVSTSEVEDLNHKIYKGGSDVDEVGIGSHKEFKSREEEKVDAGSNENSKSNAVITYTSPVVTQDSLGSGSNNIKSKVAAIVAGICLTLAVAGYVIILLWRKALLRRYGNREELINEDDLTDNNDADMHHFEASTIQIQQ